MNVSDCESDFSTKLFLVKLHPDNFVRKPLMEQTVDLCTAAQLQRVDHGGTAALDRPLEILLKLLDAPEKDNDQFITRLLFQNTGKIYE